MAITLSGDTSLIQDTGAITEIDRITYMDEFKNRFSEHINIYEQGIDPAEFAEIPGGGGMTASWVRVHPFSIIRTAGSEAPNTVTVDQIRAQEFEGSPAHYYKVVKISAATWRQARSQTMMETAAALGQNAGESLEVQASSTMAQTGCYCIPANAFSETTLAWNGFELQERIAVTSSSSTTTLVSSNITFNSGHRSDSAFKGGWVCITKGRGYGSAGRISASTSATAPILTVTPALSEIPTSDSNVTTYFTLAQPFPNGDGVQMAANHKMTTNLIRKAVAVLRVNKAPTFEDGFYRAVIHPDVETQLKEDSTWSNVAVYQKAEKVEKDTLNVWGGCRWYYSTMMPRYANTAETQNPFSYESGAVRGTFIFGKGAFGKITLPALTGSSPSFITANPDEYPPLRSYGTMAWQFWHKVQVIQANWAVLLLTYLA